MLYIIGYFNKNDSFNELIALYLKRFEQGFQIITQ